MNNINNIFDCQKTKHLYMIVVIDVITEAQVASEMLVISMVWVEIWQKGQKGSFLRNRYNEKFPKVLDFIKGMDFIDVVYERRVGSTLENRFRLPKVIASTDEFSFVFECSEKQLAKIKEVI